MNKVISFVALGALVMFFACSQQSELSQNDVVGFWEVVSAQRDGSTTKTLDGARFILNQDEFTTDMTGEEISQKYIFSPERITTSDNVEYSINRVVLDTMELGFTIRDMDFIIILKKNSDVNEG